MRGCQRMLHRIYLDRRHLARRERRAHVHISQLEGDVSARVQVNEC